MTALSFSDLVLPDYGRYFVTTAKTHKSGDVYFSPRFVYSPDKIITELSEYDTQLGNTNYYSPASFAKIGGNNRHPNLLAKRCLHADIDIGHPGFVMTQKEALDAINHLCATIGIPEPSVVVSSGHGLHVYWSVREEWTKKDIHDWQQISNGLVIAAQEHANGLAKDISKWTDRTALLRWPGTTNRKTSEHKPVIEIAGSYHRYPREAFDVLKTLAPPVAVTANRMPKPAEIEQVDASVMGDHCHVARKVIAQIEAGEAGIFKQWRHLITYACHTTQGVQWIDEISRRHPASYDQAELNRQAEYYLDRRINEGFNPAGCRTFANDAGCDYTKTCAACPLFLKTGATPLNLRAAQAIDVASVTSDILTELRVFASDNFAQPDYADGKDIAKGWAFYVMPSGQLGFTGPPREDGGVVGGTLFNHAWWPISRQDIGNNVTVYSLLRVTDVRQEYDEAGVSRNVVTAGRMMQVDGSAFSEPNALIRALSRVGIHVAGRGDKVLREAAWVYGTAASAAMIATADGASSFGWQPDGRFILGRGAFTDTGAVQPYSPQGALMTSNLEGHIASGAIAPEANLVGVIGAMSNVRRNLSRLGQAFVLAAYSAPLFKLVGLPGYMLLLAGPSGKGKTAIQRLLSCIYGMPNPAMITSKDTVSSWPQTLALYNSLPVTFDEFTHAGKSGANPMEEAHKDDFIFSVTNGRTKKVNTPEQVQRGGGGTWATLVIGSTNWDYIASLKARDMSDVSGAIMARVSQIELKDNLAQFDAWSQIERQFRENHGAFGALFMSALMAHRKEVSERLAAELEARMAAAIHTEARYKMMFLSSMMIAQSVLKSANIVDFSFSAAELAELLALDRLDVTKQEKTFEAPSVSDITSDQNLDAVDALLISLQDSILYYNEDAHGVQTPAAHGTIPRQVMGHSIKGPNELTFVLAKQGLLRSREAKNMTALPSILAGHEHIWYSLTQGMPPVECIRIRRRIDQPVITAGTP